MNTLRAGILMIICCAIALQVLSQDEDIKNIPEQVKKNAAMVIRNETIEFTVSGPDYAKLVVHRTATALDQKGLDALEFAEITDQYTTLEDVQVKVFDAAGN